LTRRAGRRQGDWQLAGMKPSYLRRCAADGVLIAVARSVSDGVLPAAQRAAVLEVQTRRTASSGDGRIGQGGVRVRLDDGREAIFPARCCLMPWTDYERERTARDEEARRRLECRERTRRDGPLLRQALGLPAGRGVGNMAVSITADELGQALERLRAHGLIPQRTPAT